MVNFVIFDMMKDFFFLIFNQHENVIFQKVTGCILMKKKQQMTAILNTVHLRNIIYIYDDF